MQEQTQKLYEDYLRNRNSDITYDEFSYILNLFPSLIICMCDGKLDQGEWEAVLQIADGLAEGFYDESAKDRSKTETAQIFRTEFRYLLENIPKWEKKFLNVLKNHIRFNQSSKEFVLECMYLLANSADGISSVEQQNIDSLSKRLGITN
jgi:hypothetical protein